MPEDMPDRMPEDVPDRMPEDMSDRMPEDLPVTKCINVMVGITRSKVILLVFVYIIYIYILLYACIYSPKPTLLCAIPTVSKTCYSGVITIRVHSMNMGWGGAGWGQ